MRVLSIVSGLKVGGAEIALVRLLAATRRNFDHSVISLTAGDELGWSAILMGRGKHFQARALERTAALAFDGGALLKACREDPSFGFALMYRMLGVVSERLQGTRLQLLDMYSPVAKRAA